MRVKAWNGSKQVRKDVNAQRLHTWSELNQLITQLSEEEFVENPKDALEEIFI